MIAGLLGGIQSIRLSGGSSGGSRGVVMCKGRIASNANRLLGVLNKGYRIMGWIFSDVHYYCIVVVLM